MKITSNFLRFQLAPVLLGAFAVFGFAPYYFFPATFIAITALFYLWRISNNADNLVHINAKQAFLIGWFFGLGLFGFGIYWIYISLHDFGGMPWWMAGFATFVLCAFLSLFPALVGWLSLRYKPLMISMPILWALSEWVRSWIFTGFPWLTIGYSQVPHSPLIGFMPIIGVYGVSLITAFIAFLWANWFANRNQAPLWKRNTIAITVVILVGGNILRLIEWTSPIGKPISIALLQGNISQDIKWSPESAQQSVELYLHMIKASKAKLIVLPETAFPIISNQLDPAVNTAIVAHAKQNQSNILIGMITQHKNTEAYFNSLINFDSLGDEYAQSYQKQHLVPFGEFIPLKSVLGWIYLDWLSMPLSDLSRGEASQTPLKIEGGLQVAANICYEDVFGEEIIRQLPQANILVNATNDAWYGKSFAADQHLQFSQARALESGRMMLRATNTGATAIIDTHGELLAHAPHFQQLTLNGMAQSYTGKTPYVRWGNWPFVLFCFGFLIITFLSNQHIFMSRARH